MSERSERFVGQLNKSHPKKSKLQTNHIPKPKSLLMDFSLPQVGYDDMYPSSGR